MQISAVACGINSMHKSTQTWSRGSVLVQAKHQNGDPSDVEDGILSLELKGNGMKNKKNMHFCGQKGLVNERDQKDQKRMARQEGNSNNSCCNIGSQNKGTTCNQEV